MENNEIKQAVEAYRRCCPSGATCKNLDGTTFVLGRYSAGIDTLAKIAESLEYKIDFIKK